MSKLSEIEREAKIVRDFISELKGLTPRFNAAKERTEEELALHLAKIDAERAKLDELKAAAALIVEHLGAEVPPIAQPEEILEPETFTGPYEPAEEVVAVIDSPQDDPVGAVLMAEPKETFQSIGEIAAEVTAAVAAIAAEPPATPDATDEPEMTDEQVERLEEQTAAALAEDVRERELETVGGDRPARRFNPFASNPFA